MRMVGVMAALMVLSGPVGISLVHEARADAEQFKALHCNKCHEISAVKVEKDKKGDDDEEEDEDVTPPDLSHAGKYHDAAFLKPFLLKELAHTKHEDGDHTKKHPKKFKGTPEELSKMVDWLLTLK